MYKTAGFGYLSRLPKPFSREMLLLHSHLGHQCHLVFAKIMNNMLFILNPYTHTSSLCCMVLLGTPPTSFLLNFRGSPFFFSGLTAGPTYRPLVRHSNPDTPLPSALFHHTNLWSPWRLLSGYICSMLTTFPTSWSSCWIGKLSLWQGLSYRISWGTKVEKVIDVCSGEGCWSQHVHKRKEKQIIIFTNVFLEQLIVLEQLLLSTCDPTQSN